MNLIKSSNELKLLKVKENSEECRHNEVTPSRCVFGPTHQGGLVGVGRVVIPALIRIRLN